MNDLATPVAASVTTPAITFAIIARRRIPALDRLIDELVRLSTVHDAEIVVGVETPGVTSPAETVAENGVRWISLPSHCGIPYNRNRVLDSARGAIVVGVDDDCMPEAGWLAGLIAALEDPRVAGAIGSIEIPSAGFVGDSISALGFPAGGSAGYKTMFHVGDDGTTDNIAAGNCALRTQVVRALGGYDESLTYGGEDTELAHRFTCANERIVFVPEATIVHPARTDLREFVRWSYVRGRAKRQFSRKVPIRGYVKARFASYGKILSAHVTDPKIVLIAPLLLANLIAQQVGFIAESLRPTPQPAPTAAPATDAR